VLAIPDGAEATKAVKGTTRQHGLPLRAIPGCVIAAYLRKIAAQRHRRTPPMAQARRAAVRRIFVAPDLCPVASSSAPIGGVVST
jgi:hypothetical protein